MTCREKLKMEHPEKISPEHRGGCCGCPSGYNYLPDPDECHDVADYCTKCWDREIPDTEEKKEEPKIDIHKIIDDAMEKRDRSVSIYIGQSCVTVNVTPYEKEEPARWIYNRHTGYGQCSECGHEIEPEVYRGCIYWPNYCAECGEKLGTPKKEDGIEEHNPLAHPECYVSDAIAMINDMTDAQRAEVIKHLEWLRDGCPR